MGKRQGAATDAAFAWSGSARHMQPRWKHRGGPRQLPATPHLLLIPVACLVWHLRDVGCGPAHMMVACGMLVLCVALQIGDCEPAVHFALTGYAHAVHAPCLPARIAHPACTGSLSTAAPWTQRRPPSPWCMHACLYLSGMLGPPDVQSLRHLHGEAGTGCQMLPLKEGSPACVHACMLPSRGGGCWRWSSGQRALRCARVHDPCVMTTMTSVASGGAGSSTCMHDAGHTINRAGPCHTMQAHIVL